MQVFEFAALMFYTHPFRPLPEGTPRFASVLEDWKAKLGASWYNRRFRLMVAAFLPNGATALKYFGE